MAAIDLLLNWSPTSERMHQVVLTGLLRHTALLDLLDIPGEPSDLHIETQGRLFDFTVALDNGRKVNIELKVDSALDEAQIKRQMAAVADEDWLVYMLLGNTRFSWSVAKLHAIRQRVERAPSEDVIKLVDLPAIRDAIAALASQSNEPDHRDLAVAYGSLLRRIDETTKRFETKPLAEWDSLDWYGFFGRLIADLQLSDAGMKYVANPSGGFIGSWWDFQSIPLSPGSEAYLQLEESLLCFKVSVDAKEDQTRVRESFSDSVLKASRQFGFNAKRPDRFGKGKYMTVAVFADDFRSAASGSVLDWERVRDTIAVARDVLAAAVSSLS